MKKCIYCAEEIQDEAKVCRFCQRDVVATLAPLPKDAPVKKSNAGKWVLLFLLGAVLVSWMLQDVPAEVRRTSAATSPPSSPSAPVGDELELLSSRGYESDGGGYYKIEGQVKNISDKPMDSIVAVGTWFSADGTFIKSDDALIEYRPLLPGQTSPFMTMSSANPAMKKYQVEFKQFSGGLIETKDSRKSR